MKLLKHLPEDYPKSPAVVELQKAIEKLGTATEEDVADLLHQFFLDSATWGLSCWEKVYGVESDTTKSLEVRRSAVRAKMRGMGTTTVELVQNVSESFVNGEVAVEEHNDEYRFDIVMLSVIGIPPNMEDLKRAIEEIKPAHLAYEIIIKYNTWGMVRDSGMTWAAAAERTWTAMKEVEL